MLNTSLNNKRIIKNTIYLYGRLILTMFISLYTARVVLNVLGVVDFGIYNVVCGFVALFSFLNASMSNGIQRFYNYEAGKNGIDAVTKVYQTAILIQLLLVLLILLVIEPLGIWYINNIMVIPDDRLTAANWVFQFSLFSLVFLVLQVPFSAAIMAHEKMDYYATVGILDAFLKLGIVLILPYLRANSLIVYGLLVLIVSILNFLLYSVYALKKFNELKLAKVYHRALFKDIFKFSGWNIVEMFAWTTQGQGVNMVMNFFCGPIVNAAQGIASNINSAVNSFCSNLVVAFRPQLVHSYAEGNYNRTINMMFTMSKAMFIMTTMMILPLFFEMNFILSVWLGKVVPQYTLEFASLVLFSMLPRNLTMALSQVVHASGKMKVYQLSSAIVISLVLPISYILMKMGYSPVYIYICNIFISILLWIVDLCLLRRIFEFSMKNYFKKVIVPCALTFILSAFFPYVVHKFMLEGIYRFVAVLIVSITTVVMSSYFFILNRKEKDIITKMLEMKINKSN